MTVARCRARCIEQTDWLAPLFRPRESENASRGDAQCHERFHYCAPTLAAAVQSKPHAQARGCFTARIGGGYIPRRPIVP
jgi:hypothetical protein